jgi:sulfur carrier protein
MMDITNSLNHDSEGTAQIQIRLNGDLHGCRAGLNLTAFLVELGLNPRLVAVEYNGEILARSQWDSTIIQGDDGLEIVTIVGGG